MKRIKDILGRYYGAFLCAALLLCPFFAKAQSGADSSDKCLPGDDPFMKAYCTLHDFGKGVEDTAHELVNFAISGCPSGMAVLEDHLSSCWICTLFYKIFDAINLLSSAVYEYIRDPSITLMTMLLAFWIAFRVGKVFISFKPPEPMDFWNQNGKVFFRVMFATALLLQPVSVMSYWIVSPLVEFGAGFSQMILAGYSGVASYNASLEQTTTSTKDEKFEEREKRQNQDFGIDLTTGAFLMATNPLALPTVIGVKTLQAIENARYEKSLEAMQEKPTTDNLNNLIYCDIPDITEEEAAAEGVLLNSQTRASLECMVEGLYKELAFSLALGSTMICNSWHANVFLGIRLPSPGLLLAGLLIWITGFFLMLIFSFKIIDATMRLGVVASIMPLLIVAWVFPQTVEYAKKGFNILLNIIMIYIVLALVMALAIILLLLAFQGDGSENIRQMFLENDINGINDAIAFPSWGFLTALSCFFIAVKIIDTVNTTAAELTEVEFGTNSADKVAVMAAAVTTNTLKSAASGFSAFNAYRGALKTK